jgi:hypothetical protein
MTGLEEQLRQLIRDEIRRVVRPEALADELVGDDLELRQRAQAVASRLRRVRSVSLPNG